VVRVPGKDGELPCVIGENTHHPTPATQRALWPEPLESNLEGLPFIRMEQ
jgi:hypothetical protein